MKVYILYIILLLSCINAVAQSVQQVEQEINNHLNRIQYWKFEYSPEDTAFKTKIAPEDSLTNANKMLLNYLTTVCVKQPATIRYDFKLPDNSDMKIITSDDKKLRLYSWDTHSGESEHQYFTVCQYETARGVKTIDNSKLNGEHGRAYQKIIAIESKYYLVIASDLTIDNNVTKAILALNITGDGLAVVDIFKEDGKPQNNIAYTYNYSSNYDFRKMKEEYDIRYEKGRLYIPEVADYKMTGKYRIYNFDGSALILDKNVR